MKAKQNAGNLNFSSTGNGSASCYECGSEFVPDDLEREYDEGDTVPCHCPGCGRRCANPVMVN